MEGAHHATPGRRAGRPGSRDLRQLRRLAAFVRPYRWQVAATLVALVLAAAAVLTFGVGLRYLIDGGFAAGRVEALDHALKASLIVVVVLAAATFARSYLVAWLGERLVADLRARVDGDLGVPNAFSALTRAQLDVKTKVILESFASQRDKGWFTRSTFEAIARLRGIECNAPEGFAEGYHVPKAVLAV